MTIICHDCKKLIGDSDELIPPDCVARCPDCTMLWIQDEELIWYTAEAKEV